MKIHICKLTLSSASALVENIYDEEFFSEIIGDSIMLYNILPNTLVEEAAIHLGEKEATAYAKANKWTAAKETWLQLYDKKNSSAAQARLANNIAIAFEMQDDLHKALEWAQTEFAVRS